MRLLCLLAVSSGLLVGCQNRESRSVPAGSGSAAVAPPAPIARDAAVAAIPDAAVPAGPRTACDTVSLQIDAAGVWLGAAPSVRCFGPRKGPAVDWAWLGAELARLRAAIDPKTCPSAVEIAGTEASFDELVQAMDAATRAGFPEVSLASPGALAMTFTGASTATSCTAAPTLGPRTVSAAASAVRSSVKTRVSPSTPVVVISTSEILVNRQPVATIADARTGDGPLAAVATAIGTAKSGRTLILQAARSVPATIVNRVVQTARQAGFDEVIFAVKPD